ncbi:MAG: DUF177 domain-containing protein [Fimbriimonadaceae bacterium]|nr:DUF177 domain-containing protein [Fimbriimonadaceae bacterium]
MKRDGLLDLNEALQHPGRTLVFELSTELNQEEDLDLLEPLDGSLEAVSTGNLLLIKGEFKTRAVVECARCGGPLELDVSFDFSEQFPVEGVPSSYGLSDFARVVPDEPYQLFEGNSLIVDALLRQALIVSLPMQPICKFGWDGDCPVALKRRADASEAHGRDEFQKLKNLLEDDSA